MLGHSYFSIFFFFSSRRRHTRFDCDWSSDVCSSDLTTGKPAGIETPGFGSLDRRDRSPGLTAVAEIVRDPGFKPTTFSKVTVRSAVRPPGSSIRAVSSLPEIVGTRVSANTGKEQRDRMSTETRPVHARLLIFSPPWHRR